MTTHQESDFSFVSQNALVEVFLPDGRIIQGPRKAPVGDFLKILKDSTPSPIVGAVVNSELRELTYPIEIESRVRPVTMGETDGMLIYRRSLTFLLDTAFEELYPNDILTIDHSVSSGGFYCEVISGRILNEQDLHDLETYMRKLVEMDLPFSKREVPIREVIAYFEAKGYTDKVQLLSHRAKDYLVLYRLLDHQDYHHGYMVPSTGFLQWFHLYPTNGGFTLHFPRKANPTELVPLHEYPKLLVSFRQYGKWLYRLGIGNVGALNDRIKDGKIHELILTSEALHEQHVAEIAGQIAEKSSTARIILISGPSSSGKTTFSKRLSIQLLSQGISPFPVEMDNFFVSRDLTPRDANGAFDFESLGALNTSLLDETLRALIAGQEVMVPHYNFKTGQPEAGEVVRLTPGQLIILEGIHGLNPKLLQTIPMEQTYRIYVSALTQLNLDYHNRISTTDTRLIRRIVRDARERGYTARDTIGRWDSVRRGEKLNIFPYQENAAVMFNSALAYELSALKPLAEPLLRQVPFGTYEYIEAKRLLAFLEWFLPIDKDLIPENSILREFLGGSNLKDFKIWQGN